MKPPLSEIFAAMSGVTMAGMGYLKKGQSTSHPLTDLSVRAAKFSYNMKMQLLQLGPQSAQTQEDVAQKCMAFLTDDSTCRILKEHANVALLSTNDVEGGKVWKLSAHIAEMQQRENMVADEGAPARTRKVEEISGGGDVEKKFAAAYLPQFNKNAMKPGAEATPVQQPESSKPAGRRASAARKQFEADLHLV